MTGTRRYNVIRRIHLYAGLVVLVFLMMYFASGYVMIHRQWFGGHAADQCHVIYGGSVKPDNIHDLISLPDVDGALVGGASLEVKSFFEIVARSRQSTV